LPEKHIRENAMSSIDRRTALALGAAATAGAAMPAAAAAAGEALGGKAMAGKSVLITGASSGFGQLAALLFARSGAKVFATMRNLPRAEADEMRKVAKAEQLDLTVLELDVLSDASVAKAVAEAEKLAGGGIDVLVNNAGINKDRAFLEMSDEEWHTVLDTILTGSFLCAQEFARRFTGESGCILNLGATTGLKGRKNGVNYCSARAGILTFTKCLALELAPRIRVNTITPGWIDTAEVRERYQLELPENLAKAEASVPLGRLGRPEEIASLMVYLAEAGSYISGQNFFVDGGYYMH